MHEERHSLPDCVQGAFEDASLKQKLSSPCLDRPQISALSTLVSSSWQTILFCFSHLESLEIISTAASHSNSAIRKMVSPTVGTAGRSAHETQFPLVASPTYPLPWDQALPYSVWPFIWFVLSCPVSGEIEEAARGLRDAGGGGGCCEPI